MERTGREDRRALHILHTAAGLGDAEPAGPLARELSARLARRGHRVTLATGPEVSGLPLGPGVEVRTFAVQGGLAGGLAGADLERYAGFLQGGGFDVAAHLGAERWSTDVALAALEATRARRVNVLVPCGYPGLGPDLAPRAPAFEGYYRRVLPGLLAGFDACVYAAEDGPEARLAVRRGVVNGRVIPARAPDEAAWERIADAYEALYLELVARRAAPAEAPAAAPPRTTVFVLTIGDPVLARCEEALARQDVRGFLVDPIRNVRPFHRAAQEMIRRAGTEFFIQVDEDMILVPHAVRRMEQVLAAAPDDVGMICFPLFDEDRDRVIQGIKIYRTALFRGLEARDRRASEIDLLEQLCDRGGRWILFPEVMGLHGTLYTPESIYLRYKTMYEKDVKVWNLVTGDLRRKAEAFR
ncbi:MAG TPA: hypothetical protein VML50_03645, partial [Anaeromyxobacter sp.]|nr:hypothetical protein [Anaeromyxobacter sp.]